MGNKSMCSFCYGNTIDKATEHEFIYKSSLNALTTPHETSRNNNNEDSTINVATMAKHGNFNIKAKNGNGSSKNENVKEFCSSDVGNEKSVDSKNNIKDTNKDSNRKDNNIGNTKGIIDESENKISRNIINKSSNGTTLKSLLLTEEDIILINNLKQKNSVKRIQKVFKSFLNKNNPTTNNNLMNLIEGASDNPLLRNSFSTISCLSQSNTNNLSSFSKNKLAKLSYKSAIYLGNVLDQIPHGFGILSNTLGGVYWGNWNKGVGDGIGVYSTSNGFRYEGYFYKDKQHSYGIEIENGDSLEGIGDVFNKYEGEYYAGVKSGIGIINNKDYIFSGEFDDNNINGIGEINFSSNNKKYIGEWRNNKMHGIGILVWENGNCHEGIFMNNVREGFGIFSTEHNIFIGNWKNSKIEGDGIIIDKRKLTKKNILFKNSKKVTELSSYEISIYNNIANEILTGLNMKSNRKE